MELELKEFQRNALKALEEFFASCGRYGSTRIAFHEVAPLWLGFDPSYNEVPALGDLPYVCIRIPTGGGKTLVACHAVGKAQRCLLSADHCLVLWLVPTTPILEQTVAALKNPEHPYRRALELGAGPVEILTLSEALDVQRPVLDAQTVVIVSTIQAFRVDDREGRKVYEQSGRLMAHFDGLEDEQRQQLELFEDGKVKTSLENVLRLRRPVVIVDEAHNARTPLSFDVLARFRPSCIIEFTATPDMQGNPSNVLFSASAAQLKADEMIKLPVVLETRPNWRDLLSDAKAKLDELHKLAEEEHKAGKPYLRPVMLLQAQPRDRRRATITVDELERCLLEDFKIPKEEIRRATGADDQLGDENLHSPESKVRYVITVARLREGWDCQFAYVLFTVAELSSPTAVEQVLGRVLRQPGAKRRETEPLNRAYAYATSARFEQAANTLRDALVQNGFSRTEAKDMVRRGEDTREPDLFDQEGGFPVVLTGGLDDLPETMRDSVSYDAGTGELIVKGMATRELHEELRRRVRTEADRVKLDVAFAAQLSRAARVRDWRKDTLFAVPILAVKQGDVFEPFDDAFLLETEWDLAKCSPELAESDYSPAARRATVGELDVDKDGRIGVTAVDVLQSHLAVLGDTRGWNVGELARWLDRNIPHRDVSHEASGIFIVNALNFLLDQRRIPLAELLHDKFRLRQALERLIALRRQEARSKAHQMALLPGAPAPVVVDARMCFRYDPNRYPYSSICSRSGDFRKHFYPVVGDLGDKGEEFECAQFLDSLDEVKCWVRNLERHERDSFWLQTSTDKFYPDFVCLLHDSRVLVVEYKSADRWSNDDSREKRALGELWAARSGGSCVFIMPMGPDFAAIERKVRG